MYIEKYLLRSLTSTRPIRRELTGISTRAPFGHSSVVKVQNTTPDGAAQPISRATGIIQLFLPPTTPDTSDCYNLPRLRGKTSSFWVSNTASVGVNDGPRRGTAGHGIREEI